ncbi:hypothetical protein [uncultured Sphingomonas sp.]|uniref:hypothetical protein n=1 Tax=uncultured Sphingomonas sp. TaxID=158754 RepID=UPI0035CC0CBE
MNSRSIIAALALSCLLPTTIAQGQFYPGGAPKWGPNGNGTLDHEDDLRWVILHDVQVTADEARGVYTAKFSRNMADMEGRPFTIIGYMLTIEPNTRSAHFVITRRSSGCPFCPPNEPTEAIEVFATRPIDYTQAPIALKGTLHLVRSSAQGLFYRMDQAVVI